MDTSPNKRTPLADKLAELEADHDQVMVEAIDGRLVVVTCVDFDADLSPTSNVLHFEREAA